MALAKYAEDNYRYYEERMVANGFDYSSVYGFSQRETIRERNSKTTANRNGLPVSDIRVRAGYRKKRH